MPLPAAAPRDSVHTRRITCDGYARADGLWDIEAHMTDTKSYSFENAWRGTIAPGVPIHEMWLRLTIDDAMRVHDVEAATDNGPFEMCPAITANFKRLIGLTIGPGWNRKVKELVGGVEGCTHLVELLGPMATVAYQTLIAGRNRRSVAAAPNGGQRAKGVAPAKMKGLINTCHTWAESSPVVRDFAPDFYVDPGSEGAS